MKKILQIVTADSWEATFHEVDGEHVENEPIICFALVEEDGETSVEGMYAQDGCIDFCESITNFNSYIKRI